MLFNGVTQRSTSSIAPGTSDGSAPIASHCSGWSTKARKPWLMAVRVVSAPPLMNRPTSCTMAAGGNGWPSMVACTHSLIRSACGFVYLSRAISPSAVANSMLAAMNSVKVWPSRSRMSMRISRSLQLFRCGHMCSG